MTQTGPRTEAGLQAVAENARELDHSAWTQNPEAVEAIEIAKRLRSTKHGLYANIPIICKAQDCPYAETCELQKLDLAPFGEKCPMEIAAIEDLFVRYCEDMNIDPNDREQQVDAMLVKEIVDIDIKLLRCEKKLSAAGDFMIDSVVSVTENGDEITRLELNPATEYTERLRASKFKTYNLLNATRKDKQGSTIHVVADPSTRAAELLHVQDMMIQSEDEHEEQEALYHRKIRALKGEEVIDVEPIDLDEEVDI